MIRKASLEMSPAMALLESDMFYFELAAKRLSLSACEIAYVPDLISLPVSCVAQRVDERFAVENPVAFVRDMEEACLDLGAPLARLYLHENSIELEKELFARGYQAKVEIGFLTTPTCELQTTSGVELSRVVSEQDWRVKLEIHRQEDVGSDGYCNRAEDWTEIMYRKCLTGFKDTFLIRFQGQAVGTIAIVESPGLRRVKNLFVSPAFRGFGLAASAVKLLLREAAAQSISTVGVFGIEGSSGCSVYRACGFQPATRQVEYTKCLKDLTSHRPTPNHPR